MAAGSVATRAFANGAAVAGVFVGAVVGGGFASGREIWQFFGSYGPKGLMGAGLAAALFAAASVAIVQRARASGDAVPLPPGEASRLAALLWNGAIAAFLFSGLAVVLAGAGAFAEQEWGVRPDMGVAALAIPTAAVLAARERGFVAANAVLTPLLVAFLAAVAARSLFVGGSAPAGPPVRPVLPVAWWWSAALYVAYNLMVAIVAIASLDRDRLMARGARRGALAGGLVLGGLALLCTAALLEAGAPAGEAPVPFALLAGRSSPAWHAVYGAGLYAALLTTALATAFGLAERLPAARPGLRRWIPLLALAAALPVTRAGLATLVRVAYPLAGYASIALLLVLPALDALARLRRRTA